MGFTSQSQKLGPSIEKIRQGFKEFHQAAQARIDDRSEWSLTHKVELTQLRKAMLELDAELSELEGSTS